MIWKRKPMDRKWKTTRPDATNIVKTVEDSLNKIAYRDDSQICKLLFEKYICSGVESPRTEIIIKSVEDD